MYSTASILSLEYKRSPGKEERTMLIETLLNLSESFNTYSIPKTLKRINYAAALLLSRWCVCYNIC